LSNAWPDKAAGGQIAAQESRGGDLKLSLLLLPCANYVFLCFAVFLLSFSVFFFSSHISSCSSSLFGLEGIKGFALD